ncbi:heme-dependent oxidative N-demethylase subunit alpha family protein [uncultured Deinococcus sp.]|uniref:heme-dependent oxidative N-demethylase subunit alpha family protein n=1 Tax=uncultured Deinococcus sp. TaxID=158789 RepID=UPI0025F30291|nr:heme-dependent oxidative N-demethylase subunit alpha family protein [uncultured Deinococcus sp.]
MRPPVMYRPFASGRYEVAAGLYRLGVQPIPWREDGAAESHTFALDNTFPLFVASKVAAHRRALHQYTGEANLRPALRAAALSFIARTLSADSGGAITWDGEHLHHALLGWTARLDVTRGTVEGLTRAPAPHAALVEDTRPVNALDVLGLCAQEDLAIISRGESGDWLAATHVLSPQHWDPRDKLGRDFVAVHAPVAGSGPMNATAPRLVDAVISRGPFVRFAWGISITDRLDHHPAAPPDADRHAATTFDPARAFVRVERQTLTGFADADGALFTIRPYTYPLTAAVREPAQACALAAAIRTMTPEQVAYKGLSGLRHDLLTWLDGRAQTPP